MLIVRVIGRFNAGVRPRNVVRAPRRKLGATAFVRMKLVYLTASAFSGRLIGPHFVVEPLTRYN